MNYVIVTHGLAIRLFLLRFGARVNCVLALPVLSLQMYHLGEAFACWNDTH